MLKNTKKSGFTLAELLVAASISFLVMGAAFALWSTVQDAWVNERIKSEILQDLQISTERIRREIQVTDGGRIFFHTAANDTYDAISFPLAFDDGKSDTGYQELQSGDGFIETDSTTFDAATGISKIFWDKTVIYHVFHTGGMDELRRTVFYPRDNSLTITQRQQQIDIVVASGTGNDASVPETATWQSTRTILKAKSISFEAIPLCREFDGYSASTSRTGDLIDFGSVLLGGDYHTIKFKVTEKNSASSGYAFGIDALKFTPSGGIHEGEDYASITYPNGSPGINTSSGKAVSTVDMRNSTYGVWNNEAYLKYAADSVNDYLTLNFYYDMWRETTFLGGTSNNVKREFSNRDGIKDETSGNAEYILRLEGYDTAWNAYRQAKQDVSAVEEELTSNEKTYRIILSQKYIESNGMMVRVKFRAGNSSLTINKAKIIQQSNAPTSDPYDGSSLMQYKSINFNGLSNVTIPADSTQWSDWVQLKDTNPTPNDVPFDKYSSYLVTFCVPSEAHVVYWEDTNINADLMSYSTDDVTLADQSDWPTSLTTGEHRIYAMEEVSAAYVKDGSYTSQIFDTGVEDPAYTQMRYNATTHSDADLTMKIRSSDDKAALESDGNWTGSPGISFSGSPGDISSISGGRYIQFRADFTASAGTPADYDQSCILKDVSIYWPGSTTMVDIGGYFTQNPNYGTFIVLVDDQTLVKGFGVKLSITKDLATGGIANRTIETEAEARNTGK